MIPIAVQKKRRFGDVVICVLVSEPHARDKLNTTGGKWCFQGPGWFLTYMRINHNCQDGNDLRYEKITGNNRIFARVAA